MDWRLESRGGKTVVRLVNSGFTTGGADWENEWFDSTSYGWLFMLTNLRHSLERHPGEPREVAWPRRKAAGTREAAYQKLLAPGGLFTEGFPSEYGEGQKYSLRSTTGEIFSGRIEFVAPPRGFCVSVEQLNDALLWLTIEGAPGNLDVQLWLSAYGEQSSDVKVFEDRSGAQLERILS